MYSSVYHIGVINVYNYFFPFFGRYVETPIVFYPEIVYTVTEKAPVPSENGGAGTERPMDRLKNGGHGEKLRRYLRFTGCVQGVGFRWRAEKAANALGATGWVRNDFDGAVSMELQGTEEQIDGVILAIERGAYVQIENMYVKTLPPLDGEYGFTVKDDD